METMAWTEKKLVLLVFLKSQLAQISAKIALPITLILHTFTLICSPPVFVLCWSFMSKVDFSGISSFNAVFFHT